MAGAAVAGVGTFGSFTDSTTPVGVAVDDGVVSIDLAAPDRLGTVPLTFDGVVPGPSGRPPTATPRWARSC
jgi:hypothetical protein